MTTPTTFLKQLHFQKKAPGFTVQSGTDRGASAMAARK